LYSFLKEISGKNDPVLILRAINITIRKIFAIDDLDKALSYYRAREIRIGDAEKNYKKALKMIDKADSTRELGKAYNAALKEIEKTEIDPNREVLNVDLTGEIFLVNDEFSNQNIERELGRMGVQTRRSLTVGSFLKDAIIPKAFQNKETHLQRAERMAKPYLMRDIGGDALECISDVVFADEKGKDGIIHISPFTCMPEIMSQNIFPTIRGEHDIPILPLIMDEQTGRAGYITRLEAFVDLMRRKKRAKECKNKTRV
jgi:predicted nucleotide-binding protein (sugar kinase/HSP70/actin superfamily)